MRAMKQYLLLRNNVQSGPYTLEALIEQNLRSLDLIWKEEESTAWHYATEMDELKEHVNDQVKHEETVSENKIYVALPDLQPCVQPVAIENDDPTKEYSLPVLEVLKERDNRRLSKKPVWQKKIFRINDTIRLAAVFAGLVFGAFVIKKAADTNIGEAETDLETSVASLIMEPPKPQLAYHNALVKEVIKPAAEAKPVPGSVRPKDIRRQVKLKTNDYKKGVFGGVSDLQLTVSNASPHFIDKIVVTVHYIKKNGQVVDSKTISFHSIAPNSTKRIEVPQNRRGVSVKTSINTIYSKDYKAALKQV